MCRMDIGVSPPLCALTGTGHAAAGGAAGGEAEAGATLLRQWQDRHRMRSRVRQLPEPRVTMNPAQLEQLLDLLAEVHNTDGLFDLEQRFGPFDEEDALAVRALFQIASMRCHLSRGPAPSPDRFTLTRPPPAGARERFEVRGRLGPRIVRVGWADGVWFGSQYAINRLGPDAACVVHATDARDRVLALLDVVLDDGRSLAVA